MAAICHSGQKLLFLPTTNIARRHFALLDDMKVNLRITLVAVALCATVIAALARQPKWEFRGAWINTIYQEQYSQQSTLENKIYLCSLLDKLRHAGCNVVIFQVRPQSDAFYESDIEPWSKHLTGRAGRAPQPAWDPLQFMVEQAHARGMELHAWLNPYRVTTSAKELPPKGHIYHDHPERFVKYAGKIYFDPAYKENRDYIARVVKDIVSRYDIDAIHLDDYFYPYPVNGKPFPDNASYKKFGKGTNRGDWRRQNVNLLIEQLHKVITDTKPWVRFGISPFGIWRNKASDADGSDTNGLQNYDDLYADVLLWTRQGWVDYLIPQLYWELEHKAASTLKLSRWWNDHANGRHLYIGQSVKVTMDKPDVGGSKAKNQLAHKIALSRELPCVQGNCWWPGYLVADNYKGVADLLTDQYQSTVALVPPSPWIDDKRPGEVKHLKADCDGGRVELRWKAPSTRDKMQQARAYVVYRFDDNGNIDIDDATAIRAVTYEPQYSEVVDKGKYTYVVTVIDRANNESPEGVKIKVNCK